MLPERNEWLVLNAQFTDAARDEQEHDLILDEAYLSYLDQSVLRGDGEDHKRMMLLNFDVRAHQDMLWELIVDGQYGTA